MPSRSTRAKPCRSAARSPERRAEEYVLGTDDAELVRLGLQHQLWAEYAASAWERAGFNRGQRLLDVGCGPGYATFDLSARVGDRGQVVAIDASPRFVQYVQSQSARRGLKNITASVGNVERLEVPRQSFDGAYARWVLCFVRRPEAVVAGVARALRAGGVFVVHDYFNYEGILIAPNCDVFQRVFKMVARSWRLRGGDSNIGTMVPRLLTRCGFAVTEIRPLVRVARPGSPLWQWPDTFFSNYLPALVHMGLINERDRRDFQREWRKRSRDPSAFFATPPMLEVIGVKR